MFIIFFSVVSIVLALVHVVIFKTFVTLFSPSYSGKLLTGLILAILGISFIISSIINSNTDHLIGRLYYHISAIWLGFMTYLFIASCLFAIVLLVSKLFTGTGVLNIAHSIGFILYTLAIIGGIYGLWNARDIMIRNTEIFIPSLPATWQGRKILMFADSHFGAIHHDRKARAIVDKIKEINPDMILISGDFFDGSYLDYVKFTSIFKEIHPPLGIYFATGNHEEFSDSEKYLTALESAGIKVLRDTAVTIDGLRIIGIGDRNSISTVKFTGILQNIFGDSNSSSQRQIPTILLKHQPRQLDIAESYGIDLQVSGHTHRAQMFPLNLLTYYIYKGYDYGLKKYGKMQVLTTSGVGTWGPPMRVGSKNEMWVISLYE